MSAYMSYMRAFGTDLRQVAVWEPGSKIDLGDYGEIRNRRWEKLGSIWDLMENPDPQLREHTTAKLERLSLGSAQVVEANTEGGVSGLASNLSLSIRFKNKQSVFVRADDCETIVYRRLQAIAERLVSVPDWRKTWTFVSEVRSAKKFLVLLATGEGAQVQVKAKTTELLDAFNVGRVSADAGIQISGSDVLQFIGRSGPIHMSLMKIRSPWLLRDRTTTERFEFAEGKPGAATVFVEVVTPDEILGEHDDCGT